jgi:very-short-patch-repair endonuclease
MTIGQSSSPSSPDDRIVRLASRQHGVVTRGQLRDSGFTAGMVNQRVRSQRLVVVHRGVYRLGALVGPLEPALCRFMAAVLVCGPDALASHESAAGIWRLPGAAPPLAPVHVTMTAADRGRRPGICRHRVRRIAPEDVASVEGVPVTAPARTLVDLAGRIRPRVLEQAIGAAERLGLVDPGALLAAVTRVPNSNGVALIRTLIAADAEPAFTQSPAEGRLLDLARRGDVPMPETNVRLGEYRVDFLWRFERIVVEVDGFAYHSSRPMFEGDRERDARLAVMGFQVVRVTWRQLTREPHAVLVRLARLLGPGRPATGR